MKPAELYSRGGAALIFNASIKQTVQVHCVHCPHRFIFIAMATGACSNHSSEMTVLRGHNALIERASAG